MKQHNTIYWFIGILILSLWGPIGLAQVPQGRTAPDCTLAFSFTAPGSSADLNNVPQISGGSSTGGCVIWQVEADAFNSGIGTLIFQAASVSNAAGTGPGPYSGFGGTIIDGAISVNVFPWTFIGGPNYYPWVNVIATALTHGTVRGTISGWRIPSAGGSTSGGGGSTTVTNLAACENGSNTIASQPITISGSGLTEIVAASGSTVITICHLSVLAGASTNITLEYGTGSNCGTGTTAISGAYQTAFGIALDALNLALPASQALCINSSNSVTAGGLVTFVQQ